MKYRCKCCGEMFDEPLNQSEFMGEFWGSKAFQEFSVSPCCRDSYDEVSEDEEDLSDKRVFTVFGKPVGKGRPKFTSRGGYARAYTPKGTADYESLVAESYNSEYEKEDKMDYPIKVRILAVFPIPKSLRKADRELAKKNILKPTKKPDIDNIVKIILDGLNGVAYEDDAFVVAVEAEKRYSPVESEGFEGYVNVELSRMEDKK